MTQSPSVDRARRGPRAIGLVLLAIVAAACTRSTTDIAPDDAFSPPGSDARDKPLAPDAPEWAHAPVFAAQRIRSGCEVKRHGEEVRIACKRGFANGANQLAGTPEGVRFGKPTESGPPAVVFPLRRGDRRVIQYVDYEANRWSWGAFPQMTISAYWLEGDDAPTIVMH